MEFIESTTSYCVYVVLYGHIFSFDWIPLLLRIGTMVCLVHLVGKPSHSEGGEYRNVRVFMIEGR